MKSFRRTQKKNNRKSKKMRRKSKKMRRTSYKPKSKKLKKRRGGGPGYKLDEVGYNPDDVDKFGDEFREMHRNQVAKREAEEQAKYNAQRFISNPEKMFGKLKAMGPVRNLAKHQEELKQQQDDEAYASQFEPSGVHHKKSDIYGQNPFFNLFKKK